MLQGSQGRYSVGARESWYPNLGIFDDLATYSMTFRFSPRNDLISVGEQVSERQEDGQKVAVWRSEQPMRVAGFNYGDFQKRSQADAQSGVTIDVYNNRGPEFAAMAGNPLADAMNTARVASSFFGAPMYRAAVDHAATGAQRRPVVAARSSTCRRCRSCRLRNGYAGSLEIRARYEGLKEFGNTVGWHEVAHQWWGHQIGWASYRDQWLSEGLAEFTAALMLEVNSGRTEGR